MRTALITGASRGFGRALAHALAADGWDLVLDARDAEALRAASSDIRARLVPGDVGDPDHRAALVAAAGPTDLLVNNASLLGPSPQPALADYPLDVLAEVYRVNVLGPLGLIQAALPHLAPGAAIVNITSDAAVEPYAGWGGYGSSKAALDQLSAVLGAERPDLHVYAFDPGDMQTQMHQEAFPGEDISDRPRPEAVVPDLLALLAQRPPSGRYQRDEVRA